MTDRELLELAARAAGIELKPMTIKPAEGEGDGFIGFMTDPDQWERGWFDPLTSDADAFRLAVKLRLEIIPLEGGGVDVQRTTEAEPFGELLATECSADSYAATRRAIVRAAAEIGKAMTVQPEGEKR